MVQTLSEGRKDSKYHSLSGEAQIQPNHFDYPTCACKAMVSGCNVESKNGSVLNQRDCSEQFSCWHVRCSLTDVLSHVVSS